MGLAAGGLSFLSQGMQGGSGGEKCAGQISSTKMVPTDEKKNKRLQHTESSTEDNHNSSVDEVCCVVQVKSLLKWLRYILRMYFS